MATVALNNDIVANGMSQGDLVIFLQNVVDLVNQNRVATNAIITAAATNIAAVAAVTAVANTAIKLTKG